MPRHRGTQQVACARRTEPSRRDSEAGNGAWTQGRDGAGRHFRCGTGHHGVLDHARPGRAEPAADAVASSAGGHRRTQHPSARQYRPGPSQRAMYDALNTIDPTSLTDSKLTTYYKSAPLDPAPGTVVKTENPKPGVTIKRDKFDVPYVYGKTDERHRLRRGICRHRRPHVRDGRAAIRRVGPPLRAARAPPRTTWRRRRSAAAGRLHPRRGRTPSSMRSASRVRPARNSSSRLDSFVAGVNAARKALCPTVTASTCPTPYRLLKLTPTPYTRADVVYAGALIGGIFGKGGGQEAQNAALPAPAPGPARRHPRPQGACRPARCPGSGRGGDRSRRAALRRARADRPCGRCASRPSRRKGQDRRRAPAGFPLRRRPPSGPAWAVARRLLDRLQLPAADEQRDARLRQPHHDRPPDRGHGARRPATRRRTSSMRSPCTARITTPAGSPSPTCNSRSSSATGAATPGRPPALRVTSSTPSSTSSATQTAARPRSTRRPTSTGPRATQ